MKQDILILVKGPIDDLDDTTLIGEKEYSKYFAEQHRKFCLRSGDNGVNSDIFVNDVEIYKFKVKYSEINAALLCFKRFFS